MDIFNWNDRYIHKVLKLEKKSYPPELRELDSILDEESKILSLIGIEKGRLVCYLIAYEIHGNYGTRVIYISDLNCPSPKYLKPLLLNFFRKADYMYGNIIYSAHMRIDSYRILTNQRRKYLDAIIIIEEICLENFYYNGETVYKVVFQVDLEKYSMDNSSNLQQFPYSA